MVTSMHCKLFLEHRIPLPIRVEVQRQWDEHEEVLGERERVELEHDVRLGADSARLHS